jgi:hypothetical protein
LFRKTIQFFKIGKKFELTKLQLTKHSKKLLYKINIATYEEIINYSQTSENGLISLQKTVQPVGERSPTLAHVNFEDKFYFILIIEEIFLNFCQLQRVCATLWNMENIQIKNTNTYLFTKITLEIIASQTVFCGLSGKLIRNHICGS